MSPRDISPVIIELVIEPRSKGDQEKLDAAIRRLAEDVSFLSAHVEEESGRTVLGGTGEEHLKVLVARLKGEFEVEADFGEPRVAYRETIRKAVEDQEYVHKKQTGGTGEFAKVRLTIEPMEGDKSPYEFVNEVTGGRLPKEFAEAVDAGVQEAMKYGVLAGYEMTGIRVILVDADYREVESSELAFKIAGAQAFKEAARKASPVLREPMMAVEVTTPEAYVNDVIGDINAHRGRIQAMGGDPEARVVKGLVPLSEMSGFAGELRVKTSGRARPSTDFDSYAEVPRDITEAIVAEATEDGKADPAPSPVPEASKEPLLHTGVIAVPLLEEETRLRMARDPDPAAPIPLLLELNRGFASGGTDGAWERLRAVWQTIGGGALKRVSEDFATGELSFGRVKELVTDDQSPDSGADCALHRVWPDFPVHTLINESAHTIKADTARRTFDSCGEKIVWAVIDSGISEVHAHFQAYPGLHEKTLYGEDARGGKIEALHQDFTGGSSPLTDEKGHGTHVAGIIAGGLPAGFVDLGGHPARLFRETSDASGEGGQMVERTGIESAGLRGMAPAAKLVSLKVMQSGAGDEVRDGRLLEALQWVRDANGTGSAFRIHGVNISIGHDFPARWAGVGYSPVCQAVDMLVRSGVVVVVAAGNTGYGIMTPANTDVSATHTVLQATINDPGNTERAITVGSTHRTSPHSYGISYFSSKGPTGDGRYKPDLVAPGERIVSCAAGKSRPAGLSDCCHAYTEKTGTSMAAPHVSGAVAAFLSSQREFIGDPDRVKRIFMESATPLGRSRYFEGSGLIDLMRALQST